MSEAKQAFEAYLDEQAMIAPPSDWANWAYRMTLVGVGHFGLSEASAQLLVDNAVGFYRLNAFQI